MNLTHQFAIYVKENNIDINHSNADEHLNAYKKKLVDETKTMEMCGVNLSIGDEVKVEIVSDGHLNGGRLHGKIKAFYPHVPQVELESGWCFHQNDIILNHVHDEELKLK